MGPIVSTIDYYAPSLPSHAGQGQKAPSWGEWSIRARPRTLGSPYADASTKKGAPPCLKPAIQPDAQDAEHELQVYPSARPAPVDGSGAISYQREQLKRIEHSLA